MPSLIRLACAICDHLLALVPDPARAKRLVDIVDPDETREPELLRAAVASEEPVSGLRLPAGAAPKRAAS